MLVGTVEWKERPLGQVAGSGCVDHLADRGSGQSLINVRTNEEGWTAKVARTGHPAATQRAALAARGVLPVAALAGVPAGREVAVAGHLVILQRPPTAKVVAFVTIEDETGLGNLVLSPAVERRCRGALHAAPLLVATGRIQRQGRVVSVQVTGVEPWHPGAVG